MMTTKQTLYIAGDSTAACKQPNKKPEAGWGERLGQYFHSNILIANHAVNGRSTKSFIEEGRLAAIADIIRPNDYLFIQFGHNDQKSDPTRGTLPFGDYVTNLQLFVAAAQAKQAIPVLLTSVSRRVYLPSGQPDSRTLGDYPMAMKEFAATQQLPILDLFTASQNLLGQLSPEDAAKLYLHLPPGTHPNYPDGVIDDTHFNEAGAEAMAQLIVAEINASQLPLKHYLQGDLSL